MPKYAKKRDDNEPEIVDALQTVGAQVYKLNETNLPDLLVAFRRQWWLIEVKGPNGKLKEGQKQFLDNAVAPVAVARNQDEALQAVGALRE